MVVKTRRLAPVIVELPAVRVATVTTRGDPNTVAQQALNALYGSVYTLKMQRKREGRDFKVSGLRARWPDIGRELKENWRGIWALPVPDDTEELPQKVPGIKVEVDTWNYGTVAQVLHVGPYSEEVPTIQLLREFIEQEGYEVCGPHEEEYLTSPRAKQQKTIIRYSVRPRVS